MVDKNQNTNVFYLFFHSNTQEIVIDLDFEILFSAVSDLSRTLFYILVQNQNEIGKDEWRCSKGVGEGI